MSSDFNEKVSAVCMYLPKSVTDKFKDHLTVVLEDLTKSYFKDVQASKGCSFDSQEYVSLLKKEASDSQ